MLIICSSVQLANGTTPVHTHTHPCTSGLLARGRQQLGKKLTLPAELMAGSADPLCLQIVFARKLAVCLTIRTHVGPAELSNIRSCAKDHRTRRKTQNGSRGFQKPTSFTVMQHVV